MSILISTFTIIDVWIIFVKATPYMMKILVSKTLDYVMYSDYFQITTFDQTGLEFWIENYFPWQFYILNKAKQFIRVFKEEHFKIKSQIICKICIIYLHF